MEAKFSFQVLWEISFIYWQKCLEVLVLPLWEQINVLFKGSEETVENLKMNLKRLEEEKVQAAEE